MKYAKKKKQEFMEIKGDNKNIERGGNFFLFRFVARNLLN